MRTHRPTLVINGNDEIVEKTVKCVMSQRDIGNRWCATLVEIVQPNKTPHYWGDDVESKPRAHGYTRVLYNILRGDMYEALVVVLLSSTGSQSLEEEYSNIQLKVVLSALIVLLIALVAHLRFRPNT
jgi:hypothetical protein